MITVRKDQARGQSNLGWLNSKHTFSFGYYYDQNYRGFGNLRVINEDQVQAGQGFGTHGHKDMEIISYVLKGALEHKDSLGNGSVIYPGDIQRMSAGTGIAHSEFNASKTDPVHFLQIWIIPNQKGLKPSYEQKHFSLSEKQGKFRLVASSDGRYDSVKIHQDADLYVTVLNEGDRINHSTSENRLLWVQIVKGLTEINGHTLQAGDGAAITRETDIEFTATTDDSEILLFDLG